MSSRAFAEWVAYSQVEPFGEERADYRTAYGLAVLLRFFSNGKWKGQPADLMPMVGWGVGRDAPPATQSDGLVQTAATSVNELLFDELVREAAPEWLR